MEKFKSEIFLKETGYTLLGIEQVTEVEKSILIENIFEVIDSEKSENIFSTLQDKLPYSEQLKSDSTINSLSSHLNLISNSEIYLIWSKNDIDKTETDILLKNWNYIWYDVSDDALIIFQKNNRKILLVTHYNILFYN